MPGEGLTGPLTFTARCEHGEEIGIGTWAPLEVLGLLDLSLGSAAVEPSESVDVVVERGCPRGYHSRILNRAARMTLDL